MILCRKLILLNINSTINETWTYFYFAGSERVALRSSAGVRYLIGDHLAPYAALQGCFARSTSIIVDAAGAKLAEMRYDAWGQTRLTSGAMPTEYQYTGQRSQMDKIGLYYYNARWMDPWLGRFAQADTLIPEPGAAVAWDRHTYTYNNPVNYKDPSGHRIVEGCGEDGKSSCTPKAQELAAYYYFEKRHEANLCNSGAYLHCGPIENEINNNRPITGVHIGYSGQAGFGVEAGPNVQDDYYLDWKNGDLYHTRSVGGAVTVGTPSILNGQINIGISNVRGIPRSYSTEEVRKNLEGPQIDVSGAIGLEAIAVLDIGFSRSQDITYGGEFVINSGSEMYTDSLDLSFGFDTFPNLFDAGLQVGGSTTSIIRTWNLW